MIGQKFLLKIVLIYKHCITTLGRISGFAIWKDWCVRKFVSRCSNLGIDSYSINSAKERNASTQRKKLHQQNKEYSVIDK
jgi:hypothetical protein